jgi:TatD DNase family protein
MYIDIHTHQSEFSANIKKHFNFILREELLGTNSMSFPSGYGSLGIHPWYIPEADLDLYYETLYRLGTLKEVRLIGEAGLDKVKGPDFKLQEEVFLKQIRIAEDLKKPVLIHCVKAYNELIAIKKIVRPKVPMIIHGFNRNLVLANELLKKGFYLSFGEALLKSDAIQLFFKELDINQLFFETDDSLSEITAIYNKAAEIKSMEVEQLIEQIEANYLEILIG